MVPEPRASNASNASNAGSERMAEAVTEEANEMKERPGIRNQLRSQFMGLVPDIIVEYNRNNIYIIIYNI